METTNTTPPGGAKRLRLTERERIEHLSAWKHSGRSARDYAAEHGLRAANLYAWSKKRRSARREPASGSSFVPVRIAPGSFPGTGLRVTLKARGLECMVEGADGPEALAALAAALKREVFDV
jgi:hypothetical protein